jgi:hypothetical protein
MLPFYVLPAQAQQQPMSALYMMRHAAHLGCLVASGGGAAMQKKT